MHPCMLGHVFVRFFPIQLETFIRRRKVVTWSRPRTKILPAASRGQWLTQHEFLMVTRPFRILKSRVSSASNPVPVLGNRI